MENQEKDEKPVQVASGLNDVFGDDENDDYRLKYNSDPVCPHCGYIYRDAWEINFGGDMEGSTTITCGHCEEEYFVERVVTIEFNTAKLKVA